MFRTQMGQFEAVCFPPTEPWLVSRSPHPSRQPALPRPRVLVSPASVILAQSTKCREHSTPAEKRQCRGWGRVLGVEEGDDSAGRGPGKSPGWGQGVRCGPGAAGVWGGGVLWARLPLGSGI